MSASSGYASATPAKPGGQPSSSGGGGAASAAAAAAAAAAAQSRWYWSREQLINTPSVAAGIAIEKELSYRQQAANFIQDMGQRLKG